MSMSMAKHWYGRAWRLAAPLLALAALPAAGLAQQDSVVIPTVTLTDAVRLAQAAQPAVVQARGSLRNADAQVRSAKGAYLPSLTASSSGATSFSEGPSRINPVTQEVISGNSTNRSVSFGISSSVDLFTGFRRGADSRAAKATQNAADAALTDQEAQAALTATQEFFDALAAQQLVRVREASVRRAQEQLNLSVAKLRVGSATRSDSLRSLVNLGNAQVALLSSQSDVARTQAALGRTLGYDGRVAAADDSSFYAPQTPLDTAAITQEALARSPQVVSAEASAKAADASVKAARAQYFPTLALSGSAGWNGSNNNDYQLFATRQLQLGLVWPIFNRFQREQTIATRLSSLDVAEANAKDTRRGLQASLTTEYAALEAARLRIDITKVSVTAAEEDLRVVNERYRVGAATILDVLNSQEALAQAEVDVVNARFDYLKARAQIEALIGRHL
jgi:outer membrane protein TolC